MFKILTTQEYNNLINVKKEAISQNTYLDEITRLQKELKDYKKQVEKDIEEINYENDKNVENIIEDYKIKIERKDQEVENKIHTATKELKEKIEKLTIENNNNKKEVEIMTTAFKNVGFDVKDMKAILDKLVDGVVSKNTIPIVL